MKIKAKVEGDKIIIPNLYNLRNGEIWIEIEILDGDSIEHLELWEKHLNDEKETKKSIDVDAIEVISQELGLRGIKVEDLIDDKT